MFPLIVFSFCTLLTVLFSRLHLSSYYAFLLANGLLTPAIATAFNNNLHSLQDASVQLRRIATTPSMSCR